MFLKSHATQKCVLVIAKALACLSFTAQDDVCAPLSLVYLGAGFVSSFSIQLGQCSYTENRYLQDGKTKSDTNYSKQSIFYVS